MKDVNKILILVFGLPLLAVCLLAISWFFLVFAPFFIFAIVALFVPAYFLLKQGNLRGLIPSDSKARVLFVDDDPNSLLLIEHLLEQTKIDFKIITNGNAAREAMKKNHYDWIVLDYDMPELSGAEVLMEADKSVANEEGLRPQGHESVPVIGYSSKATRTWNLPELRSFRLIRILSKSMPLSKLKQELEELGLLKSPVTAY